MGFSELFSSADDPEINQAISEATALANMFERFYHGK